jgi:hypothetical protein
VCSQPGAKSAVVSQDENATVVVILLGGEGWCVHGDVWNSVREELVSVSLAGSSCPEAPEVLLEVRVFVVERV